MLEKVVRRLKRKARVRAKIYGTETCPRLSVFRSNLNIYAQIINDNEGKTICSASNLNLKDKGTKSEIAALVGTKIAEEAKKHNVTKVVFDRNGFDYHGRVKSLADSARKAGLEF